MEYKPRLPEHNDNISQTHPIKEFVVLLGGLIFLLGVCYLLLGFFIDHSVKYISPELEQKWFKKSSIDQTVLSFSGKGKQPGEDVQKLFASLQSCANTEIDLSLTMVASDTVNAVAIPGGHIVVYAGLMEKLETENGFAFVLAHELAHFQHRDHLRGMGRGLVLAVMASIVTGSDSGLVNFLTPVSMMEQARHSKSRETDADSLALDILNCHYGHVGGATEFFEAMRGDGATLSKVEHYFSTHPEVSARITALDTLIEQRGYQVKETLALNK